MIYADLKNINKFKGIYENLDTAIDYITTHNLNNIPDGKTVIDGDNVYVNCFSYSTINIDKGFFEAHTDYLDLHIDIEGNELIGVTDISHLNYVKDDRTTDFTEYSGNVDILYRMNNKKFLIAFPEDAHMVKITDEKISDVRKAVFKIKIK